MPPLAVASPHPSEVTSVPWSSFRSATEITPTTSPVPRSEALNTATLAAAHVAGEKDD